MNNLVYTVYKKILILVLALPGLGLFFVFVMLGEWLNKIFLTPFPSVVYGMLAFLIFLIIFQWGFKKIPITITRSSHFFLPIFPLFILPSCVGIVSHFDLVKEDGIKILIALIIGIILTQIVTPIIFISVTKVFNKTQRVATNPSSNNNSVNGDSN